MKRILSAALAAATMLALAACGGPETDPCLSAPNVKQCEATRAASSGGDNDALLYGVGGYLLGSAINGGGSTHTRTVERRYYSKPSYRSYTPSYSRPSYRSSYSYRSSGFRSGSFGRRR